MTHNGSISTPTHPKNRWKRFWTRSKKKPHPCFKLSYGYLSSAQLAGKLDGIPGLTLKCEYRQNDPAAFRFKINKSNSFHMKPFVVRGKQYRICPMWKGASFSIWNRMIAARVNLTSATVWFQIESEMWLYIRTVRYSIFVPVKKYDSSSLVIF